MPSINDYNLSWSLSNSKMVELTFNDNLINWNNYNFIKNLVTNKHISYLTYENNNEEDSINNVNNFDIISDKKISLTYQNNFIDNKRNNAIIPMGAISNNKLNNTEIKCSSNISI